MSEGNDRPNSRHQQNAAYTMHPYYYQQYYAAQQMAAAGYMPVVAGAPGQQHMAAVPGAYPWPMYAAGYPQGVPMVHPGANGMPAYYFPYPQAAYGQYSQQYAYQVQQQQQPQVSQRQSAPSVQIEELTSEQPSTNPAQAPSIVTPETQLTTASAESEEPSHPPPPAALAVARSASQEYNSTSMDALPLQRKVSRGFAKDSSKWRLSRTNSKPSLVNGEYSEEEMELPSSPLLGRRASFSVSPRQCGTEYLSEPVEFELVEDGASPTSEVVAEPPREPLKPFSGGSSIHLVDAVRILGKEMEGPTSESLIARFHELEEAASTPLCVTDSEFSGETIGLQNPVNTKICYLNSVMQILLPIAPLVQLLSLSLSHGSAGPWTTAFARAFRLFFHPPMGVHASLLNVAGMDSAIKQLGGIGTQQDVAEALGIVLNNLHEEWKHPLRKTLWSSVVDEAAEAGEAKSGTESQPSNHGLEEDSIIYKLFRGVRYVNKQLEILTQIHLAPPGTSPSHAVTTPLVDLLTQSFDKEIHYLPPVLRIELSRHLSESQLTASQSSVAFSGTLRIPESCCTKFSNTNERLYELVGVVVRSGLYANSGHYWAAHRRGQKWFWVNDTEVAPCDVSEDDQKDTNSGLISKKLDAANNWCVLIYADVNAKVAIHPYM